MSGLRTTEELLEQQKVRDTEFALVSTELAREYHDKNIRHRDAYRRINGADIERAFDDLRRKMDGLGLALKYKDVAFDMVHFLTEARDLATYSVMYINLVHALRYENMPKGAHQEGVR